MDSKYIIHILIPARGGSKSIKNKNIKLYKGLPLIYHTINTSKLVQKFNKNITKIIVSTDSKKIKNIAVKYGAEVPFKRPEVISGDHSTDFECFNHYLSWCKIKKKEIPDILIHLRPTYPERSIKIINEAINLFIKNKNKYSSLRSVIPIEKSLFKMYTIQDNTLLPTFFKYKKINEPHNQARQILPKSYLHNGYIDILSRTTLEKGSISGNNILPFIMDEKDTHDIDTEEDWNKSIEYYKC